jgi:hypothetical protein
MKWVVSGQWKIDGKAGSVTVDANGMREALAAAKDLGFDGIEAVNVGTTAKKKSQFPDSKRAPEEAYGLTRRMAWWAIVIGLFLSPVLFGIPAIVWGVVAIAKMNRMRGS